MKILISTVLLYFKYFNMVGGQIHTIEKKIYLVEKSFKQAYKNKIYLKLKKKFKKFIKI